MPSVAYQLLGRSPSENMIEEHEPLGERGDGTEEDGEDEFDSNSAHASGGLKFHQSTSSLINQWPAAKGQRYCAASHNSSPRVMCCSLRQLRAALFIVATLLFLTFLAQLANKFYSQPEVLSSTKSLTDRSERAQNRAGQILSLKPLQAPAEHINKTDLAQLQYVKLKHSSTSHPSFSAHKQPQAHHAKLLVANERPLYENYLTSVLRDRGSLSDQVEFNPFNDLLYPSDGQFGAQQSRNSAWWRLRFRLGKTYVILENYIRAMKSFNGSSSITLTTQATSDFMHHAVELCKRWDGPISLAVFCPGVEFSMALILIKFMRQCLPEPLSACVRDKITWHLVYQSKHGPPPEAISFPRYHMDEAHYSLFIQTGRCPKLAGSLADTNPIKQFEIELRKRNQLYPESYRQKFGLTYPINVLRNTARQTAQTKFVLASDIELYPSAGLVPKFINMLKNHDLNSEFPNVRKFIFTLPIFEVKSNITTPPRTKQELVKLVAQEDAIFFHKWVCDACQDFPNRLEWLKSDSLLENHNEFLTNNELTIFELTRRNKSREFWEPIFIGTKEDPEYDDRLSWDGRRDKMGQMYEMCLQGYHLFVLGNAFLVHAPGIKRLDQDDFRKRLDFIRRNNAIYDSTIAKLREQYKLSEEIKIC